MQGVRTFGLALKGDVESFKQLVKYWQERDDSFNDIEFLLNKGGEDWLFNGLMTSISKGIDPGTEDERRTKFSHNRRNKLPNPCTLE